MLSNKRTESQKGKLLYMRPLPAGHWLLTTAVRCQTLTGLIGICYDAPLTDRLVPERMGTCRTGSGPVRTGLSGVLGRLSFGLLDGEHGFPVEEDCQVSSN
jgi:hypothetical protein